MGLTPIAIRHAIAGLHESPLSAETLRSGQMVQ